MRKLFHFDSPTDNYRADAAVLWCFDNRFDLGFRKFLKRCGIERYDAIKLAGGAKVLASPANQTERSFVLDQLRASMRLHGTTRAILMLHSDCGAYGGLAAFDDNPTAEREAQKKELTRAATFLRTALPELQEVTTYWVDFEGVWEWVPQSSQSSPEPTTSQASAAAT